MVTEEHKRLISVASNLKNDVKEIQSKINTQGLLIEAIDATNNENRRMISESRLKFMKAMSKIRKDPRNKIILILVLIAILLLVYLLKL
eukprot:jgi/Antlo1/1940/718